MTALHDDAGVLVSYLDTPLGGGLLRVTFLPMSMKAEGRARARHVPVRHDEVVNLEQTDDNQSFKIIVLDRHDQVVRAFKQFGTYVRHKWITGQRDG